MKLSDLFAVIISLFTDLEDTPSSYEGQSGKAVIVNETADGLVFGEAGIGEAPEDGNIYGRKNKDWEQVISAESNWEADGESHIKPKDAKEVKVENIDGAATDNDLSTHTTDKTNPHEVEANQVDTETTGETVQNKLDGLDTNKANVTDVVNLDQTIEQEIVNGIPTLEPTREITGLHHLTDKMYVDVAATGLGLRFYLTDTDSGIVDPARDPDKYLMACSVECPETPFTRTYENVTADQYLDGWATGGAFTAGGPFTIIAGIYSLQLYVSQSVTKNCKLQWKMYVYDPAQDPGQEETLIGTSATTDNLDNTKDLEVIPLFLDEDVVIPQDGRIIGKLFVVESDSPTPDVTVYGGGTDRSHLDAPTNKEVLDNVYAPKSHTTDKTNPHEVEASQIDTSESATTVQDKLDELDTNKADNTDLESHTTDKINPHEVEANQIDTEETGKTVQDKLNEIDETSLWQEEGLDHVKPKDAKSIKTPNLEIEKEAVFETEYDNGDSGASAIIDWTEGNKQKIRLTADTTIEFTNPTGVGNFILKVSQDVTGNRKVTSWDSDIKWAEGSVPVLTSDFNAIDIICFYYDGVNYFGQIGRNFY